MLTDQELYEAVEGAIRTVMNLNGQLIGPSTAIVGELGAESIDFLDISCEIEKRIDLQVDFRQLFRGRRAQTRSSANDLTLEDVVVHLKARKQ